MCRSSLHFCYRLKAAVSAAVLLTIALSGGVGCLVDFSSPGEPPGDAAPSCGNGYIEMGEECDGENIAGRTCADLGFASGTISCRADCLLDRYNCEDGCGNNRIEGLEECDDGLGNSDTAPNACRTDCSSSRCGDNVADTGEICDGVDLMNVSCESLGFDSGTATCDTDCGGIDASGCEYVSDCGDGVLDAFDEVCDGNELSGETCLSQGYLSGDLACLADCSDYDTGGCLRPMGEPCTTDQHCEGGLCHSEAVNGYPGGMCSEVCHPPADDCTDGICVEMYGTENFCMPPCTTSQDCRPGYGCFAPWYGSNTYCFPRCEADNECPETGTCNLHAGHCNSNTLGDDTGAACADPDTCLSNVCWFDPPNGYCTTLCKLSTGICPGDGLCADAMNGTMGDMGMCLDGCTNAGDCPRAWFNCTTNPYGPAGMVCLN